MLSVNKQQIKVPYGTISSPDSSLAPIMSISRDGGQSWIGKGTITSGSSIQSVTGSVVENGPLYLKYKVSYMITGGKSYTVFVTIQHNEKHVLVDEYAEGLTEADRVAFQFSYKHGVNPDARLRMASGGYDAGSASGSGEYAKGIDSTGKLPYQLGLYGVNTDIVPRSTAFWNDSGTNAILFSIYRAKEWVNSSYYVYHMKNKPESLCFYATSTDAYMKAVMYGLERHWAISVIPKSEMQISNTDGTLSVAATQTLSNYVRDWKSGAGPEVRLYQKLTDFSLNRYKDIVFDWSEPGTSFDSGHRATFDEYWNGTASSPEMHRKLKDNMNRLIQVYWDYSGDIQHSFDEEVVFYTSIYANSRSDWALAERKRIRSILLFLTNAALEDNFHLHTSMLSGHANFADGAKSVLAIAAGIFPNHPSAGLWKQQFMKFWDKLLIHYTRQDEASLVTYGGRWYENVANYWQAVVREMYYAAKGLYAYDGTRIFNHNTWKQLIRWSLDTYAPDSAFSRLEPVPIGAHANGETNEAQIKVARLMQEQGIAIGGEYLYVLTNGEEGTKPSLQSRLYTDYGAVLWYNYGGANQAFVTLQQLNGSNYRWSPDTNGVLYFSAKGKRWSWNENEANGDEIDYTKLSLYDSGGGRALRAHPVDGVLYNFGFVQYYKAIANNGSVNGYKTRGIMLFRDNYLAIYDDLNNTTNNGSFRWSNYKIRASKSEWFADTNFSNPYLVLSYGDRYLIGWPDARERYGYRPQRDQFSARWTTDYKVQQADMFTFAVEGEVHSSNALKVTVNNKVVIDTAAGIESGAVSLAAGYVPLVAEYRHTTGSSHMQWGLRHGSPSKASTTLADDYHLRMDMPAITGVTTGPGDELHIVEPRTASAYTITSKSYGAKLNDSSIIMNDQGQSYSDGKMTATAKTAYAGANELALFEGTRVGYGDFAVETVGGDFGISAKKASNTMIEGKLAGRSGGTVKLKLPEGFTTQGLTVKVNGNLVSHTFSEGVVTFSFAIQQSDGVKSYTITSSP